MICRKATDVAFTLSSLNLLRRKDFLLVVPFPKAYLDDDTIPFGECCPLEKNTYICKVFGKIAV